MTRARIPPELRTAARVAKDGLRVTVTIGDVQYTVEPVDAKPQESDDPFEQVRYGKP
jgi:hypothetical protein